jgi:hypothetical protein
MTSIRDQFAGFKITKLPSDIREAQTVFDGWPPQIWQRNLTTWLAYVSGLHALRLIQVAPKRDNVWHLLDDLYAARNAQPGSIAAADLSKRILPGQPALVVMYGETFDRDEAWLIQHPADADVASESRMRAKSSWWRSALRTLAPWREIRTKGTREADALTRCD